MEKKMTVFIQSMILFILSMSFCPMAYSDRLYPFGKLFTTPNQRSILDSQRYLELGDGLNTPTTEPEFMADPVNRIKLSGVFIRSDGTQMVWINGRSELSDGGVAHDVMVLPSERNKESAMLTVDRKIKTLKPGQIWVLQGNQLKEGYEYAPLPPKDTPNSKDTIQANFLETKKNTHKDTDYKRSTSLIQSAKNSKNRQQPQPN